MSAAPLAPATRCGELAGVLVVGIGNSLRRDDGIGPQVVEELSDELGSAGAVVLALHQLTPEVAIEIAASRLVVFVDATAAGEPGSVTCSRLRPGLAESLDAGGFSHGLDPGRLLALAGWLSGSAAPPGVLVGVAAQDLEPGTGLSGPVEAARTRLRAAVLGAAHGLGAPGA